MNLYFYKRTLGTETIRSVRQCATKKKCIFYLYYIDNGADAVEHLMKCQQNLNQSHIKKRFNIV